MNTETPVSFFGDENGLEPLMMSLEHAASSYGIPVLVDALGNAYGPEDIIPFEVPCRAADYAYAHGLADGLAGWPPTASWTAYEEARRYQMERI